MHTHSPGGGLDELPEVVLGKVGVFQCEVVWHLDPLPVDPLHVLKLLLGDVPQPLDLLPLDLVQLVAHVVVHQVELGGDGAVPDLVGSCVLQLTTEVGVALQDLNHLLKVP